MPTVIKAGTSGTLVARLSTVDLADYLAEARALVDDARRQAGSIVSDARAQAVTIHADAQEKGYSAGHAKGVDAGTEVGHQAAYAEARARFDSEHAVVVADMTRVISEYDACKEDLLVAAERDVLELAVRIATKLTFSIGELRREAAQENLRRVIRQVSIASNLTVKIHPDDVRSIKTFAGSVLSQVGESRSMTFEADDSIAPGGCVVDSGTATVDASLETQVSEIVSLLLGEAKHG